MKFLAHTTQLSEHLYRVQGIAGGKSTMPALSHVLLKVEGQRLTLAATDMDLALEDSLEVKVDAAGSLALPAKNLFEIIKALPAGEVSISQGENNRVEIKAGKSQFRLVGMSAQEFPALPKATVSEKVEIPARELARMIDSTLFCVSTDDARYNLTGVYWQTVAATGVLRLVATDGHRLALIERGMGDGLELRPVIVPKRTLVELRRVLPTSGDHSEALVRCGFSENHAVFELGSVTLVSRLVDGQFPEYSQVIPKSSDKVVKVARGELTDALKRVSLLSPDKSFGVRLLLSNDVLRIESQNPELGEANQEVTVEYDGPELTIGFNAHYLLDALALISEGGVRLELSDHLSPGLIRPLEARDFSAVVMPMRV